VVLTALQAPPAAKTPTFKNRAALAVDWRIHYSLRLPLWKSARVYVIGHLNDQDDIVVSNVNQALSIYPPSFSIAGRTASIRFAAS
jgi:hypothetical protein